MPQSDYLKARLLCLSSSCDTIKAAMVPCLCTWS